jgi:hypothetical protein
MRPGLDKDDIYIMVEDEFHAVAQQFTKHLHHAEYVRLKNAAKNRNVSTIKSISRPTDSVTTMRDETKKKKQAEAQEMKAKAGVDAIIKPVSKAADESEESDFENEGRIDDPWQGTQLQRFMTKSPKKNLTGLTGLQGVVSYTRAAAGMKRPEKPIEKPTSLFETRTTKTTPVRNTTPQLANDSTSESDDDLDAPVRATSRAPSKPPALISRTAARVHQAAPPPPTRAAQVRPTSPARKLPRRSFLDMSPLPKVTSTPTSKPPDPPPPRIPVPPVKKEPAELPRLSILDKDAIRRRKVRRERAERERKKSSGGVGVDEIPIFLV